MRQHSSNTLICDQNAQAKKRSMFQEFVCFIPIIYTNNTRIRALLEFFIKQLELIPNFLFSRSHELILFGLEEVN